MPFGAIAAKIVISKNLVHSDVHRAVHEQRLQLDAQLDAERAGRPAGIGKSAGGIVQLSAAGEIWAREGRRAAIPEKSTHRHPRIY